MDKTPALARFRVAGAAVSAFQFGTGHKDTPGEDRELMAEMPAAREDHGGARLLDRRDHFLVALGAAGLDEGRNPGTEGQLRAVGEREERIGGENRVREPMAVLAGLLERDPHRVDTAHLARADPERLQVAGKHNRVRGHVFADAPGKEEVAPERLARRAADDFHPHSVLDIPISVLDEQSAEDALEVPLACGIASPLPVDEYARRRLLRQRLEGTVWVTRREQHLDELRDQQLGELLRNGPVQGDDAAVGRDGIGGERQPGGLLARAGGPNAPTG